MRCAAILTACLLLSCVRAGAGYDGGGQDALAGLDQESHQEGVVTVDALVSDPDVGVTVDAPLGLEGGPLADFLTTHDLANADLGSYCSCTKADLDSDGTVDGIDLGLMLSCMGKVPSGACKVADLDSDGQVDNDDMNCVSKWFGASCP
jgi:Dockerin type I domain